jgi:hypothetical protein
MAPKQALPEGAQALLEYLDDDAFARENAQVAADVRRFNETFTNTLLRRRPETQALNRAAIRLHNMKDVPDFMVRVLTHIVGFCQDCGEALRNLTDYLVNHVQDKVRHFHHALAIMAQVVHDQMAPWQPRTQRLEERLRFISQWLGAPTETRPRDTETEAALLARVQRLEGLIESLRSDVQILNFRAAQPASALDVDLETRRSESGASSLARSFASSYARLMEARDAGDIPGMMQQAQYVAWLSRAERHSEPARSRSTSRDAAMASRQLSAASTPRRHSRLRQDQGPWFTPAPGPEMTQGWMPATWSPGDEVI